MQTEKNGKLFFDKFSPYAQDSHCLDKGRLVENGKSSIHCCDAEVDCIGFRKNDTIMFTIIIVHAIVFE